MRLTITILVIVLLIMSCASFPCVPGELEFYYMTSTGYSCAEIADKWNDGFTTTMTPVREGVVAINVDWVGGGWKVISPLKLRQKIHIEGMGDYFVEDTGPFTEKNYHFDKWNLDVFYEDPQEAKEHGVKRIKVIVLEDNQNELL